MLGVAQFLGWYVALGFYVCIFVTLVWQTMPTRWRATYLHTLTNIWRWDNVATCGGQFDTVSLVPQSCTGARCKKWVYSLRVCSASLTRNNHSSYEDAGVEWRNSEISITSYVVRILKLFLVSYQRVFSQYNQSNKFKFKALQVNELSTTNNNIYSQTTVLTYPLSSMHTLLSKLWHWHPTIAYFPWPVLNHVQIIMKWWRNLQKFFRCSSISMSNFSQSH